MHARGIGAIELLTTCRQRLTLKSQATSSLDKERRVNFEVLFASCERPAGAIAMNQMKLCMVGSFRGGQDQPRQRYVQSIFTDKYHTTVGVKVDKKDVVIGAETMRMMIWDLAGEDAFSRLQTTFLRGCGRLSSRRRRHPRGTLDVALDLNRANRGSARAPAVRVGSEQGRSCARHGRSIAGRVSALERERHESFSQQRQKTAQGVESIFEHFASLDGLQRAS